MRCLQDAGFRCGMLRCRRFGDLLRPGVCRRDADMASPCMASLRSPPDYRESALCEPAMRRREAESRSRLQGTFDSLNPLIVLGVAPDAVPRYVLQSLMMRSQDEPFTLYGLVARSVEMPEDRSFITFNLDPRARFSDGHPLTAEDVRFSFEALKKDGKPFHRSTFGQVKAVEILSPQRIRFDLAGSEDRECP